MQFLSVSSPTFLPDAANQLFIVKNNTLIRTEELKGGLEEKYPVIIRMKYISYISHFETHFGRVK